MTSKPACSRRDFFAAATAAGLALGGAARAETVSSRTSPSNRIRVALIGNGMMGSVLLDTLQKIPGVEIAAVCDIWKYARQRAQRNLRFAERPANC